MAWQSRSSRQRFREYRQRQRNRRDRAEAQRPGAPAADRESHERPRPARQSLFKLIGEFWRLIEGQRTALIFALVTLSISTALRLFPPAATKITIDYVLGDHAVPAELYRFVPESRGRLLLFVAGSVVVISLADLVIALWGRWQATRATKRVQVSVRRRVFEHAVRLPLERVYQLKSGGVASILRDDAGGVGDLIFSMVYNPWRAVLQLIGSLAVLAWVDWRLLLGSLVLVPLVIFTHSTWVSRIRPLHKDIRTQRQDIDGQTTETFGGMRVVRAFRRELSEEARFTRGSHLMARQELNAWWTVRGVELIWDIVIPVASAGLLLYGGLRVLGGQLSLGDLMMFLAYLMMLLGPIGVLASSVTQLQGNLAGLERVLDLVAEPREMPVAPGAISIDPESAAAHITLRNVSFRYPAAADRVLHGVDLDVPPGQMVAFVGPSGSGKTTLSNLIARFYDPTEGAIELDGVDLRQIDVRSYRRLIGIVEQDVFLFDGTVAENIGYASRRASRDDIARAARVANAHDFIAALDRGYDTLIGERGVRLSGGERQRIAIARAVLANPRILILDEATSNLDSDSERLIQQSLHALSRGRTTFVIAHRLSTIVHADRIVVLEKGRIIETGTHAELMASSRKYRHMVRMQTGSDGEAVELATPARPEMS
jgi:ATP-binding cassette subfamily B protein/subfamily B ATP-binding cassette protein MsbA